MLRRLDFGCSKKLFFRRFLACRTSEVFCTYVANFKAMLISKKYVDQLTYSVIGSAIEVHKSLGPGLIESVYERCLVRELGFKGISYETQVSVPIQYKGVYLDTDLRLDVLVENILVVELKSVDGLLPIHEAVLLTYMKLLEKPKGILINFNCTNIFKSRQKTLVNSLYGLLPLR